MNKTLNTRIQQKRDTATNWESKNPLLLNGEMIIVDTADGEVRTKIGDGVTYYADLPFVDDVNCGFWDDSTETILEQELAEMASLFSEL